MKISKHAQNTADWKLDRLGKPTASAAKSMITSVGKPSTSLGEYAEKLAREIYTGEEEIDMKETRATKRGHELEPQANAWLEFEQSVDIVRAGFCLAVTGDYGMSPDGLIDPVFKDGDIVGSNGLAEYKCQESKGHHATLKYWAKHKKLPSDHIAQTAMQMLVADAEYCLLTHYHPTLPCLVVRINRDPILDGALITQINNCIEHRDESLEMLSKMAA